MADVVPITVDGRTCRVKRKYLELLDFVRRTGSLSSASKELGVTYKTALTWVKELEASTGLKVIERERGGKGGGGSKLTDDGIALLGKYYSYMSARRAGFTRSFLELRMSARNVLEGVVVGVEHGGMVCRVDVRIDVPQTVTAIVTSESVERLAIREGEKVFLVLKATEAIVMK